MYGGLAWLVTLDENHYDAAGLAPSRLIDAGQLPLPQPESVRTAQHPAARVRLGKH
jgi:hypothetical protein